MSIDNPTLMPEAERLATKRYFLKDENGNIIENWDGLSHRIVNHVCQNESEEFKKEIFDLIYNTKFLPNSPCIVNAGKKKASGALACFVSPPPQDTWQSMIENIKTFGDIARVGGGNGTCFSYIRPEGDPVFGSTHAKACGPIEHMRMVSEVMTSITQSGFRGMAILGSLHVNHPDIEKFIVCKQRERALKTFLKEDIFNHFEQLNGKTHEHLNIVLDKFISNFNISVLVTDDFMQKVEKDEDFDLVFAGKVYKTVKAKDLFYKIVGNAWRNGDPGLLFYDAINDGPYKYSGQEIVATNPCLSGDTLVRTEAGPEKIQDLVGKECNIFSYVDGKFIIAQTKGSFLTKKDASVIHIKLNNLSDESPREIICTPEHKILTTYSGYVEAGELKQGSFVYGMPGDAQKPDIFEVIEIVEGTNKIDVYDLTVDHPSHNFVANGIVVKNCGEQQLPSKNTPKEQRGGCCNLGSIDISKYYNSDKNDIDYRSLQKDIRSTIQFLDDVIDVNVFPGEAFELWAKENRPVGLGIMGWADLLLKMGIAYGSQESLDLAEKVMKFFEDTSHKKSVELAKEKGTPEACRYEELGFRRNITLTSIAPTGSISMLAGCSSSIEPIYTEQIFRYDNTGEYQYQKHPFADKKHFRCAVSHNDKSKEITWEQHVDMQIAFQKYCSSGISKTINMSSDATIEDVANAYMRAWRGKTKGITVYRDGCKTTQVLNTREKADIGINNAAPRPKELNCDIYYTKADGFDWHLIIGKHEAKPYELFAVNGRVNLPSSGRIVKRKKRHYSLVDEQDNVLIDNLADEESRIDPKISLETRRFSLEMRHGIPPKYIVQQIDKSTEVVNSFSKAAGRILKKYLSSDDCIAIATDIMCPACAKDGQKNEMIPDSGCWKCACGYSRCS